MNREEEEKVDLKKSFAFDLTSLKCRKNTNVIKIDIPRHNSHSLTSWPGENIYWILYVSSFCLLDLFSDFSIRRSYVTASL